MNLGMTLEELLELATREEETEIIQEKGSLEIKKKEETLFQEGLRLLRERDYLLAAAHFLALTLLDPHHVKAWNNLGIAYFHLGERERAQRAFEEALRLDPQNQLARENMVLFTKIYQGGRENGSKKIG